MASTISVSCLGRGGILEEPRVRRPKRMSREDIESIHAEAAQGIADRRMVLGGTLSVTVAFLYLGQTCSTGTGTHCSTLILRTALLDYETRGIGLTSGAIYMFYPIQSLDKRIFERLHRSVHMSVRM